MILIVSSQPEVLNYATKLTEIRAKDQGFTEEVRYLQENCFSGTSPSEVVIISDTVSDTFGVEDYHTDELANFLIRNLPSQIKTVYVVGCSGNFIKEGKSYVSEVAKVLATEGRHIKICAFTNLPSNVAVSSMVVNLDSQGVVTVYGSRDTKENNKNMAKLAKQIALLKAKVEKLEAEIFQLESLMQRQAPATKKQLDQLEKLKTSRETLYPKIKALKDELDAIQHEVVIFKSDGQITNFLDTNKDFQFHGNLLLLEKQIETLKKKDKYSFFGDPSQKVKSLERDLAQLKDKQSKEDVLSLIDKKIEHLKYKIFLETNKKVIDFFSEQKPWPNVAKFHDEMEQLNLLKQEISQAETQWQVRVHELLKDEKFLAKTDPYVVKYVKQHIAEFISEPTLKLDSPSSSRI